MRALVTASSLHQARGLMEHVLQELSTNEAPINALVLVNVSDFSAV